MNNNIVIDLDDFQTNYDAFTKYYQLKKIPKCPDLHNVSSVAELLNTLADFILNDLATVPIFYSISEIFTELVSRLIEDPTIESKYLNQNVVPGSLTLNSICKIVNISNELSSLAEFFIQRQQFFSRLAPVLGEIDQNNLHAILLAFYRLLKSDREKFRGFVDPEVLYQILQNVKSTPVNKYLSIQVLSICLELSESVKNEMIKLNLQESIVTGYYEGDLEVDYNFLPLLEAQRLSNFTKLPRRVMLNSGSKVIIKQQDLSSIVVSVCGVLIPTFTNADSQESSIVPIAKSINALKHLAENVQRSKPTMLIGKSGTGKTFLINELAKLLKKDSNSSIIKIHLNDQTDAKILLGTYTSGATPGSFIWKNGVLTTAVKEGKWVLVEDIDKAPTEVLSILLTLLEKNELTIPSRGEVIKAANGFQLISTVRLSNDSKDYAVHDMIGLRMWDLITLPSLDNNDLMAVLKFKFPLLTNFLGKFINVFDRVSEIYNSKKFVSLNKGSQPRPISVRDFVKFCGRVSKILQNNGISNTEQLITTEIYDMIFQEATDCFTSSIVEEVPLNLLINEIGQQLEIATSRIQLFLNRNIPRFEEFGDVLKIGRANLKKNSLNVINKSVNTTSFAKTGHSLRLMEQIGVSISMCEPVLLVGETGTGKTTVVQQVAKMIHKKLTVINVSQQTEVGDLLGGYKPVNTKVIALPIQESFEELFNKTFSLKKNAKFLNVLSKCFNKNQWKHIVRLWKEAYKMAQNHLTKNSDNNDDDGGDDNTPKKKRRLNVEDKAKLLDQWNDFYIVIDNFEKQSMNIDNAFAFQFIEGSLVKAVRNGDWLLLDEINLASPETLESIADLLSETVDQRNILLSEKGDIESIKAHQDFRIFGCMNPSTDVGKRDLPPSIRSRFTEIYVHSPDKDITDLLMIIDKYIGKFAVGDEWCGNDIAQLYLEAKELANSNRIVDGANQKPHFSIRTLTRTLIYVCDIVSIYGLRRSLYEGFCMSFLTLLDAKSEELLKPLIEKHTIGRLKNARSVMKQIPADPSGHDKSYVQFRHYWMKHGPMELNPQPQYIITPFVEKNMLNLVRATSGRRFPVLIQGPTSSGKTSMINYLANITGHKFVRINNHEHTDLQEYLGTYVSTDTGKLEFREGVLVEALRKGYWIVLDELNLAPTDVLEALNRLLDDNRELFIPETQEVIHPHPDFMLFATQNPPGLYGGRKILSRAFRNRFLELHYDDIPQDELETILRERCQIAPSYGKKIVQVYRELSVQRQATRFMEQGNSFATLRDLFRWAQREAVGYEQLAANGYMLLAERVRRDDERLVVKQVIEKVMKVKLEMSSYYHDLENSQLMQLESSVVWTKAMRRLSVLVSQALKYDEPILLVGETGCGKTTICQLIADFTGKNLISVNAHQNTETGDILGAQRPLRNRSDLHASLITKIKQIFERNNIVVENESFEGLCEQYDSISKFPESSEEELEEIKTLRQSANVLFEWNDGPLIQALKEGQFFLLDEISLADDSVLERLNSVLEPERSLLLAEKGTDDAFITAKEGFKFMATMNPGGDYGKKELSPALRNRFTEIWVPSMDDFEDVRQIVSAKLDADIKDLCDPLVAFSEWFGKKFGGGNASNGVISLRDILAWVDFINTTHNTTHDPLASLLHGASMVFIDALGTNNTAFLAENESRLVEQKHECVQILSEKVGKDLLEYYLTGFQVVVQLEILKCGLFEVPRVPGTEATSSFNLHAPTTAANAMRVIRAMQVHKPILLEGSPGVGKTSLISALAAATGNHLTRINLSEQTDLIDLFGSDAPAEGGETGEFVWRDAPFLRAMQKGEWVLLDEMNLASQSVLEGLNACLDHRGEAYIPELDRSFTCHPNFLVFAAQNPQYQGGGRKGLPKSFVNRFSVVYVDMLKSEDLNLIAQHLYPNIHPDVCGKMISFISKLEEQVVIKKAWGASGAPWEFNLRDTLRWLELLNSKSISGESHPADFFDIIVAQRFRSQKDREIARDLFVEVFGEFTEEKFSYILGENFLQVGKAILKRKELIQHSTEQQLLPLQCLNKALESVITCINHSWPLILTGPTGSGKTDLIRFVAAIIGAKVDEFSMNSEVDSMDILGGYEQVDLTRSVINLSEKLKSLLLELIAINLRTSQTEPLVISQALKLLDFINKGSSSTLNFAEFKDRIDSFSCFVPNNEAFSEIKSDAESLSIKIKESKSVKFEWFDGLLIQAVEKGNWLVLDNANLCNPSVLDRLNSLLEPNGCLMVNECSDSTGQPRVIKPHPNFRLFLTVDPKYGELSRAMRNRGIEMYLENLESCATNFDKETLGFSKDSTKSENDLESSLAQLTIGNDTGRPLGSFNSSSESFLASYFIITDVITRASGAYDSELSNVLTGALPFLSEEFIERWAQSVRNSTEFSDNFKQICTEIHDRYIFLKQNGIIDRFSNFIITGSESVNHLMGKNVDYMRFQALNPLLNAYILPVIASENKGVNSAEPFYLFEVVFGIMEASLLFERLESKSLNGKIIDLNFLEKSAAVAQGRNIKNAPKLKIYNLIKEISAFIKESLLDAINNEAIFESDDFYKELFELQILWKNLIECSHNKNESKLRVYQQLIESWISKNKDIQFNAIYLESLIKITSSFSKNLLLTSGFSIQAIWEHFRSEYPSSDEAWINRDAVNNLAKEFDAVSAEQFYENNETINELRSVIAQLYEENLLESQDGFDSIFDNLSKGVLKLKDISSRFLNKRAHHFKSDFNILLNFIYSFAIYNEKCDTSSSSYLDLYHLAGKPTEILANTGKEVFRPYPRIFDFLSDTKDKSALDGIFTDKLTSSILESCSHFSSLSGFHVNQSMRDISKLGSALLLNSNALMADQKVIFRRLLADWFLQVSLAHLDSKTYDVLESIIKKDIFSSDVATSALTVIQEFGNASFTEISERFFIPALLISSQENIGWDELGKSWVIFSSGCIQLFVPNSPLDPATSEYVSYDIHNSKQEFTDSFAKAWTDYVEVSNAIVDTLPKFVDDAVSKPRVFRPSGSCDPLFDTWNAFMQSSISAESVQRLLDVTEDFGETAAQQIELFQTNSFQFLSRLSTGFSRYSDLNDILKGYVFGLKFGFGLMSLSKANDLKSLEFSSNWPVDIKTITSPAHTVELFAQVQQFCKLQSASNLVAEKVFVYFMRLFFIHNKAPASSSSELGGMLQQVFQGLYYRWTLRRMKTEEEEATKASLYRHGDFEVDAEADFKLLFPDFDNVMTFENDKSAIEQSALDDSYYEIAKLYLTAFSENTNDDLDEILNNGLELSSAMNKFAEDSKHGILNSSQLTIVISQISKSLNKFKSPTKDLDFYRGFSPIETKRAGEIMERIQGSTHSLLQQWPEHATLQNIFRSASDMLKFPSDTPVAKLLAKVEQVYTFISEWEKYAHSKISLKSEFDELTNLIISWRKLELSTWRSLFEFENHSLEKNLGKWWFYLFETVIVPLLSSEDEGTVDEVKLLGAVNVFLSQATCGEFGYRLSLLKAFKEHLRLFDEPSLLNAISNIITFYEQFEATIDAHVETKKKVLEKKIQEVILLASWKDVNIDALKQSARRSHQSLYKVVRKYRLVLSETVSPFIEQGVALLAKSTVNSSPISEKPICNAELSKISDAATLIFPQQRNIMTIERNMKIYISGFKDQVIPNIYEFSKDLIESMEYLKKETPTKLTDETKKEIAALKTQKRKLLSNTLKELRRIGLKTQISADLAKTQSSVNAILARSETFQNTLIEGSDSYFFRILDLMPRLRASVSSCAEDVPVSDVQKGLGIAENLLFSLISTRQPLLKLSNFFSKLQGIWGSYEYLSSAENIVGASLVESLKQNENNFRYFAHWLPMLCDHLIFTVNSGQELSNVSSSVDIFYGAKQKAEQFAAKFEQVTFYGISTMEQMEFYDEFTKFLNQLVDDLINWKVSNPKYAFVADSFVEWIDSRNISFNINSSTSLVQVYSIADLEAAFRNLTTTIIVSIQKVVELQKASVIDTEEDNWLRNTQQRVFKYAQFLFTNRISARLEECLEITMKIEHNTETSKVASSYYFAILPFLNNYMDLAQSLLNKLKDNYVESSHGSFIMASALYNLTQNGFCSPEEQQDAPDSGETKDGTGLGDGEGATNNSNDVEDDEDLSEQAQAPNEDQKEKDENDDDDAVDIEGDMAGELEDAPGDDDDDEDDKDAGEDEDLDEEIDDLDDLDPNAIDDKMWDEEAQDNSKEKDSEKMPENSNEDDDLQANEDEDMNDDKQDDKAEAKEEKSDDKQGEEEEHEEDDENGEEEDVGEQEDAVTNAEENQLDPNTEEADALDLPEDMNLDSGDEEAEDDDNVSGMEEDVPEDVDVDMDMDAEEQKDGQKEEEDQQEEDSNEAEGEPNNSDDQEGEQDDNEKDAEDGFDTGEDADDQEEVDSEEELKENSEENANETNPQEDAEQNAEGVDGLEDAGEDAQPDLEASAKQDSGEKGEGTDAQASEEQEDIGASGSAQQYQQKESDPTSTKDEAREEATESLKELGDAMKEFHRRRQEILDAKQDDLVDQSAAEKPDDFQHIDGENTEQETQALGAASKDQIQSIDDDMAIDDEEDENEANVENDSKDAVKDEDVEDVKDENLETQEQQDDDGDFNGQSKTAFIGERKREEDLDNELFNKMLEDDMDVDEESEVFDTVKLQEDSDNAPRPLEEARDLWRKSDIATQELSAGLCEQLRLILAPTLATKLKGDYKTGKRLNMKRIIPYIASQFRKDKIWLRRTKPSKRQYQIMIAVDDSKSMAESKAVDLAFESIALVSKALTQLESGGLSIVKFGENTKVVHPFDAPFTSETGAKVFQWFDFKQTRTDIKKLCNTSLELFNDARSSGNADLWQLEIIISDGVCEDHDTIQRLVRRAREEKIMLVFVIIDGINSSESIMDMSQISYVPDENGKMVLKVDKYLDSFPFEFYVVVHNVSELPEMLSVILRQYFSELASM